MHEGLGYPVYFIPFIGVAKLLGVVAILIPGYPRIKEWAYAGFFFDLIGATYSIISLGAPPANWIFMALPLGLGICSYVFYHRKVRVVLLSKIKFSDQSNYYQNDKIKIADAKIA
jgi:hypothetical protein